MRRLDLTGQSFGSLTVIKLSGNVGNKRAWTCQCACGNITTCTTSGLVGGRSKSCGCARTQWRGPMNLAGNRYGLLLVLRHVQGTKWLCLCECGKVVTASRANLRYRGMESCGCQKRKYKRHGKTGTPEWQAWAAMIGRCTSKTHKLYPRYGGRGIAVCPRWHSFANFLADMGLRPGKGYSLDRIDNDGSYCPENCRWATYREQNRNRGNYNRMLMAGGMTKTISEWASEARMSSPAITYRLGIGWSPEQAVGLAPKPPHGNSRAATSKS